MGTKVLDIDVSYTSATNPTTLGIDADEVNYSNATSGLSATDAQAAIDEVEARLDTAETNITSNDSDITTIQGRLDDLEDKDFGNVTSISSGPYTVLAGDSVILVDASSGAITVNLPTASGINGKEYIIKKTDSDFTNAVTVDGNGSETIDGDTTFNLVTYADRIRIVSNGTNWHVLDHSYDTQWNSFTPTGTWTTNATYTGWWKRCGPNIDLQYQITVSTGAPTPSGALNVDLPSGLGLDTANIIKGAIFNVHFGDITFLDSSASAPNDAYRGFFSYITGTTDAIRMRYFLDGSTFEVYQNASATAPFSFGNADEVYGICSVPISGWR